MGILFSTVKRKTFSETRDISKSLSIWKSLLGLFLFAAAHSPLYASQADEIRLIVPHANSKYIQLYSHPLASILKSSESISLRWIPAEYGARNLVSKTNTTMVNPGPLLWFAWSEDSIIRIYSDVADKYQPNWVKNGNISGWSGSSLDGVISIGAGWHHGGPDAAITISIPARTTTMPILSMAIIPSPDKEGTRSNEQLIRKFIQTLFSSDEGQHLLRAMTVMPAAPDSGTDSITVLFQPDREDDDDDCDCDDENFQQQQCDPDGRYKRSMIGLERLGGRVLLPAYKSLASDDDDDCDDCGEDSITLYEYTGQEWSISAVNQMLESGRDRSELDRHLGDLVKIKNSESVVIVMSCDPD